MFEEDLDEFLDEEQGFASTADIYFADGGSDTIKGILTGEVDTHGEGSMPVTGRISRFECSGRAASSVKEGDRIVIEDISYLVRGISSDGSGWIVFDIERL